jgi:hypothetical protein
MSTTLPDVHRGHPGLHDRSVVSSRRGTVRAQLRPFFSSVSRLRIRSLLAGGTAFSTASQFLRNLASWHLPLHLGHYRGDAQDQLLCTTLYLGRYFAINLLSNQSATERVYGPSEFSITSSKSQPTGRRSQPLRHVAKTSCGILCGHFQPHKMSKAAVLRCCQPPDFDFHLYP